MTYPTPDPSASLSPFQQYAVEVVTYTLDTINWARVVGITALSLALVFLVVIAVATAIRR